MMRRLLLPATRWRRRTTAGRLSSALMGVSTLRIRSSEWYFLSYMFWIGLSKQKYVCIFYHFLVGKWHKLKSILMNERHGSIYPSSIAAGDARTQGINSHGFDLVVLEYSSLNTRAKGLICDLPLVQTYTVLQLDAIIITWPNRCVSSRKTKLHYWSYVLLALSH